MSFSRDISVMQDSLTGGLSPGGVSGVAQSVKPTNTDISIITVVKLFAGCIL